MKTKNVIENIFGTSAKIVILRKLITAPQALSGRQIAELTGLTHRGVIQALSSLIETGIIRQRQVGRAYQYSIVKQNIIIKRIVLPTFIAEERLLDLLKKDLINIFSKDTVSLILFGSFARGEETWQSDIDLLAVTSDIKKKAIVDKLNESKASHFREKYNSLISVHSLTLKELQNKKSLAFLKRVKAEGILLHGKSLEELNR